MTTLLVLGLMFLGAIASLVLIPLVLLKVTLTLAMSLVAVPFKILGAIVGGLSRGLFKGLFWLVLLLVPLALLALPLTILGFGAWLLQCALRRQKSPMSPIRSV